MQSPEVDHSKRHRHSIGKRIISATSAPLWLPPLLVGACAVGLCSLSLSKRKRQKLLDASLRFLETGPWGAAFDQLTWHSWQPPPRCVFATMEGDSCILELGALPAVPFDSVRTVVISDTHGKHSLLRLPPGDLLIHCGDILSRNACIGTNTGKCTGRALAALRDFNCWLGSVSRTAAVS